MTFRDKAMKRNEVQQGEFVLGLRRWWLNQGLNESEGELEGKNIPGEGIESTKALRQVCVVCSRDSKEAVFGTMQFSRLVF